MILATVFTKGRSSNNNISGIDCTPTPDCYVQGGK